MQLCLAVLRTLPQLLVLSETFLDAVSSVPTLDGYCLIGRRDRGSACGGVAVFATAAVAPTVALLRKSETAERIWVLVHCDCGPLLVGCWYRPPCYGETASIESLTAE